jgi:hypothetical protein
MSKKRSRRRFTDEFKAETVKLVKQSPERAPWGLLVRTPSIGGAENADLDSCSSISAGKGAFMGAFVCTLLPKVTGPRF